MLMNWNEALSEYGIDFTVAKRPLFTQVANDTTPQLVDNLYSIVREDTWEPLSGVAVNGRYQTIQNSDLADIGNRICAESGAEFVGGGTFKGGQIVWLQAKMPDVIRIKDTNDVINKMITFITGHGGSHCFMAMPETTRVFCDNQMNAFGRSARDNGVKIRHTASAESRLAEADDTLLQVMNAYRAFEVKCNFLADQRFSDLQMEESLRKVFGVKSDTAMDDVPTRTRNNMQTVRELFEGGLGISQWRGTAWAGLQAFTEYSNHHRSLRGDTNPFESKLLGSGAAINFKALQAIESALAA